VLGYSIPETLFDILDIFSTKIFCAGGPEIKKNRLRSLVVAVWAVNLHGSS
jgi:hypothetical protein